MVFSVLFHKASAVLVQPRCIGESSIADDPGMETLTTYPEVVCFLLKRYATDEVIANSDAEVTCYRENMGAMETELS